MAMKRKRSTGSWEYCIRKKGVLPKPVYLTFSDEAEGDAYVARIEALLRKGIVPPEIQKEKAPSEDTLTDVIRAYQKAVALPDSDTKLLDVLRAKIGNQKVTALGLKWADAWIQSMKRVDTLAPSTIRHYVGALARCLDWLVRRSPELLVTGNPLRQLPRNYASYTETDTELAGVGMEDQVRDRRLQPGEEDSIRRILAGEKPEGRERAFELKHRDALVLLFDLALETAMRMREMFTLTPDQIDLAKRTVFLDKTKNGDKRQVPLSSVAVEKLGLWALVNDGAMVFPWWDGEKGSLAKTTSQLSVQFGRIFKAAKCNDLRFHDLRHEATARIFERTNLSDLQIAKITGHKDPRMLARYANLRGSDLADALW